MEEDKLADVPPEETFRTSHGKEIKSLKHLKQVLDDISPDSFTHHVNPEKNDFANWIRHSVDDPDLADQLERTTDFNETKEIVAERIEFLERRIEIRKIKESLDSIASKQPENADKIEPIEPVKAVTAEDEPPQPQAVAPKIDLAEHSPPAVHPFEHLKKSTILTIRDALIGFVFGLLVGYALSWLA